MDLVSALHCVLICRTYQTLESQLEANVSKKFNRGGAVKTIRQALSFAGYTVDSVQARCGFVFPCKDKMGPCREPGLAWSSPKSPGKVTRT